MAKLFETSDSASAAGYAVVAPELGLDAHGDGLAYAVPEAMADLVAGERVRVPLGRGDKPTWGYVVKRAADPAAAGMDPEAGRGKPRIKTILERDSEGTPLPAQLIELARWIAGYYVCPLGMVLAAMVPAAVKRGTGAVRRTMVRPSPEDALEGAKLSKLQAAALEAAKAAGDWIEVKDLAHRAGAKTASPVKQLLAKGALEHKDVRTVVSDLDLRAREVTLPGRVFTLSDAQRAATAAVTGALGRFGVFLLHGVTGSGKTEVYLRAIQPVLEAGRSAIALVPEIALTPQTVGRFTERFGPERVAVLHSGLTPAQRHAQWRRIARGRARVVVGARSAVFAPLADVGLLVVDEEHEPTYKQDQLPRYHARDVAIKRASLAGAPVVLGSATPSLESWFNVGHRGPGIEGRPEEETNREGGERGGAADGSRVGSNQATRHPPPEPRSAKYTLLSLPDRAAGMRLPRVEIVDLQEERKHRRGVHLMSRRLEQAITQTIEGGGQALVLLNRRGYANYIACPDHRCGWMMRCDHCDAAMIYHKGADLPAGGVVRCHHCEAEQRLPKVCPTCGRKVTVFGLGVQRVQAELEARFAGARVLRMDSDTMRAGADYRDALERFGRGEVDILLGTQMIAKGLDFERVRLVGVISGDTSLHMPDFRAAERTFQLIAQVAGRAGRGEHPGTVIVQSFNPEDPAIVSAAAHDYEGFAARELGLRAEMGLPPLSRMARIVTRDPDHARADAHARRVAQALMAADRELGAGVRVRPPSPCPIARIADYHRVQVELLAPTAGRLQRVMTAVRNAGGLVSDAHTAVDVDPVSLL